ncbi:MAG: hypothetical protein ACXWD4_12340 [Bacteroidia bacterium]
MRKILLQYLPACLFMAILLYSNCGYFAVYSGMQYAVKKEVKRKLKLSVPKNELHLLKIAKQVENEANVKVFQRIHDGEFRYYGEMYDIVYRETKGDTTYYHCIHDKEEEVLFAGLSQAINVYISQNPEQQKKQNKLLQSLAKEYLAAVKLIVTPKNYSVNNCRSINNNIYISCILYVASPPPQLS